jgi:imidazolonepropionase-like amidohydrolase
VIRFAAAFALVASLGAAENSFILRNATICPVTGPKIENATLLVIDGKIADLGV